MKDDTRTEPRVPITSWIGHRGRELLVHARRVTQRRHGRRVVIFATDDSVSGSASELRAIALAPELRRLGWRVTCVPKQLELTQRLRIIKAERPDAIFLQQSVHALNRPRYYNNIPCVFDADDAVFVFGGHDRDAMFECCRDSAAVIAGSRYLADVFRPYNARVAVVWTGTYLGQGGRVAPSEHREPILTWAASEPHNYPHEAEFVREVVLQLAKRTRFSYRQYGVRPDLRESIEAFLSPIRRAGVTVEVLRPMSYRKFVRSLEAVAVGLQPLCVENPFSLGKSFGKTLAYLAADVAVVTTDAVDHPLFFKDGVNGALLPHDVDRWVDACAHLLEERAARAHMVAAARTAFRARLTTRKAAELVSRQLLRAIEYAGSSSWGGA
jgi:Glycosyl transferases group 1